MIIPLILPSFDKSTFVHLTKEALDKSISGEPLVLLSKAFTDEQNDIKAIQEAGSLTRHLTYSFLIAAPYDIIYALLSETDLHINFCDTIKRDITFAIVSGNLQQWRDAVINCSKANHILLPLINEFLGWLDKYGYQHLFINYRRKKQNDGTFLLEHKK